MKITRAMLKNYRKNRQLIRHMEEELLLAEKEVVSDTVRDYRSGFPHTRVITGVGTKQCDDLSSSLKMMRRQVRTVDDWIESIGDDMTRITFDLYYRKGRTWKAVAKSIGYGSNEDYPRVVIRDGYLKRMKIR